MNELFPGRPDYVGPTKGYFAFLHHEKLFEKSHDVMERVAYVKREKPDHEVPTRLHNMIYLPFMTDELHADYEAKVASLYADYKAKLASLYADWAKLASLHEAKLASLRADYEAKLAPLHADILTFVRQHIPDYAWNGRELVFPESR
jgi:hypothetical protein